jgi:hypothetical protein
MGQNTPQRVFQEMGLGVVQGQLWQINMVEGWSEDKTGQRDKRSEPLSDKEPHS